MMGRFPLSGSAETFQRTPGVDRAKARRSLLANHPIDVAVPCGEHHPIGESFAAAFAALDVPFTGSLGVASYEL